MNNLPSTRSKDIVIQELDGEILIYDSKSHKAYNLNETSAIIYKACDGKTSFADLRAKYKFTDDLIFFALDELKKENLLEESKPYNSPFAGISRRSVLKKVALGSLIALPVISSLAVPRATQANSVVCVAKSSCNCTTSAENPTSCIDSDACGGPTCVCNITGRLGDGDNYFGICADFDGGVR